MAKSNISDSIDSEVGNEAEEYVESIIGSQRIVRVDTPLVTKRSKAPTFGSGFRWERGHQYR